jgi:hypothetical protein
MPTERPHDAPFGMPSPEALQMATDATRRCYVLPETMQHPEVRSQCVRLAYLIQAFGLASAKPAPHVKYAVSPRHRDTSQYHCHMGRSDRTRELAEAL